MFSFWRLLLALGVQRLAFSAKIGKTCGNLV